MRSNSIALIFYKAIAELRVEASRAFIGVLWWVLEPVLYMLAFYLIFAAGFRTGGADFVPFLLCGLVPWKWFNSTILTGSNTISANRGLINQIYFHKVLLINVILAANTIKYLIILSLLLLFLLLTEGAPSINWFAIPILMLAQFLLMLGIVSITASIVPFFFEAKLLIDNGVLMLFFLSGIFFDIDSRPAAVRDFLYLNPMAGIIKAYRDVLMAHQWPDWSYLGFTMLAGILLFALGYALLTRFDRRFAKVLS